MPVSSGKCCSNSRNASMPPAEAPTPTTRNATPASTKRGGAELLGPTAGSDGEEADVELSDDVVKTILGLRAGSMSRSLAVPASWRVDDRAEAASQRAGSDEKWRGLGEVDA